MSDDKTSKQALGKYVCHYHAITNSGETAYLYSSYKIKAGPQTETLNCTLLKNLSG